MAKTTGIGWVDATHNFWYGCRFASAGCLQCYAKREMEDYGKNFATVTKAKGFDAPLKWKGPKTVFVNSWSDFFIDVADPWRSEAWNIVRRTRQLTYLILTKRSERIADHLPADWGDGWPNVWLGVSVENRKVLRRLDDLARVPAKVRFVSYEPALEYVNFTPYAKVIDWLISGGESGPAPRSASLDWFRQVRDDCLSAGVLYFHKQHGGSLKVGGAWGGRVLDGRTWDDMPRVEQPIEVKQLAMF